MNACRQNGEWAFAWVCIPCPGQAKLGHIVSCQAFTQLAAWAKCSPFCPGICVGIRPTGMEGHSLQKFAWAFTRANAQAYAESFAQAEAVSCPGYSFVFPHSQIEV